MRSVLFVSVVVACGLSYGAAAGIYKSAKGCTTAEVEKCGTDFVPYYGGKLLATTPETMKEMCGKYLGQIKCGDDFATRCIEGLARGTVLLMLRAARDEYQMYCNATSPKYKTYFENIECVNKAGPGLSTCMSDMFVGLHRAADKASDNQKLAYTCCYYKDFSSCAKKALKTLCGSPAADKFFNDITEKVFGEVLDLTCKKYLDNPGTCEALPKLSTKDDSKARNRGFVEPIAIIASKLG